MVLASNLIKRENTLQQLTGSEADLAVYPKPEEITTQFQAMSVSSPRPVGRSQRASTEEKEAKAVESAVFSPQLGGGARRTPPRRKAPSPKKKEFRESGLMRSAAASNDIEVQELAKLLLQGRMDDATKLVKHKSTLNTKSYEGEKNSAGQYHGTGTLVFKNDDVYTGRFVFVALI